MTIKDRKHNYCIFDDTLFKNNNIINMYMMNEIL